jgi:PAS domain S-box-containing protein
MSAWLRFGRAEHSGLIDSINRSQAIIEFELDGTIVSANQNFLAAVGYSLDEIRGNITGCSSIRPTHSRQNTRSSGGN